MRQAADAKVPSLPPPLTTHGIDTPQLLLLVYAELSCPPLPIPIPVPLLPSIAACHSHTHGSWIVGWSLEFSIGFICNYTVCKWWFKLLRVFDLCWLCGYSGFSFVLEANSAIFSCKKEIYSFSELTNIECWTEEFPISFLLLLKFFKLLLTFKFSIYF